MKQKRSVFVRNPRGILSIFDQTISVEDEDVVLLHADITSRSRELDLDGLNG